MAEAKQPDTLDSGEHNESEPFARAASSDGNGRALELLRASEARYRRLFETAQDGILLLDAKSGQITDVNPFMVDMLGYPREHFVGRELWEIGPVKDERPSREAFRELQAKRYVRYEDLPLETFDGQRVQVEFVSNVYEVGDAEVIQCNIRNISARKEAEAALQATARKIVGLHEAAHQLETSETEDEVYRLAVEAAESILGLKTCSLYLVIGDELVVKAVSSGAVASEGQSVPIEGPGGGLAAETLRTGKAVYFGDPEEAPGSCLLDSGLVSGISVPVGSLGVFQARSSTCGTLDEADTRLLELLGGYTAEALRRIRLQTELKEQATRDPLTGVYNRRYFTEVIAQETSRAQRHGRPIGLLMIDVNRFKQINDRLGHPVGDKVLRKVGGLLQAVVRGEDFVIRYGGDEFLVVLPETDGETEIVKTRILDELRRWNTENPELLPFPLTLAIGEAHWMPESGQSLEEILADADRGMYDDKRDHS